MADEVELISDENGLALCGHGLTVRGDFERLLYRVTNGRLSHELLIKAAKTDISNPKAIDATAGMGEDAFLLAAYGYEVTMYEKNTLVSALLKDAMHRGKDHPIIGEIVSRMHLIEGDSTKLLSANTIKPDLIYLDPMFPARKKSGLVNKRLQLIQKIENPCEDEDLLLECAMKLNPKKLIVKRPLKGSELAGKKPSYSLKGKAIRYDCFVFS